MSEKSTQPKKKSKIAPFVRGQQVFKDHLFRLKVEKMQKNKSYKKFLPELMQVEHVHLFHTKNQRGQDNEYCVAVGGHFHKMDVTYDESGSPVDVKCGPALRKVEKRMKNGKVKSFIEPVRWERQDEQTGEMAYVTDDHTHEWQYEGFSELSAQIIKDIQKENKATIGATAPAMPHLPDAKSVGLQDVSADV